MATVSAALHNTGRVGPVQRKRIQAIAQRLRYRPQLAARILRSRRKHRLGFIVTEAIDPTRISELDSTAPFLTSFVARCEQLDLGYNIEFPGARLSDPHFDGPEVLLSGLVDGVITVGYLGPAINWFQEHQPRYPWVSIYEPAEHAVLSDIGAGIHWAVEHLVSLGHRRIGYV